MESTRAGSQVPRVISGFLQQEDIELLLDLCSKEPVWFRGLSGPYRHTNPHKRPTGRIDLPVAHLIERALGELDRAEYVDSHFFMYRHGEYVAKHRDDNNQPRRLQMNHIIKVPEEGGALHIAGVPYALSLGDAIIFNGDLLYHEVTPVTKGERIMWQVVRW